MRLSPLLQSTVTASYHLKTSKKTPLCQNAATVEKTLNNNASAGDLVIHLRGDAPHCCRTVNGLTAAPGRYLISCTSKRTHTHPLPKHHPPGQNNLFETPFSPPSAPSFVQSLVSFSSFASSVRALHFCARWLRSPPSPHSLLPTLFPLCALLSNELKNTLVKYR